MPAPVRQADGSFAALDAKGQIKHVDI